MAHRLAVLALPGVVAFDLGAALQIFGAPSSREPAEPRYDVIVVTPGRKITTAEGLTVGGRHGLADLRDAETIVVPGYDQAPWLRPPGAVVSALQAAARSGKRVMSICIGAFALAHAGLLDGRRATTHWAVAAELAEQFPSVEVVPEVLYVDEGAILTSAGLAAGIDLALHVVRNDHGAGAAADIARWNVVAPHRDGGQAQYMPRPVPPADSEGLARTQAWALQHLDQALTTGDLARHAHCSDRTLTRRFQGELGVSPKRWLLLMQVHRARELLETTTIAVEDVATRAGFSSAAALRDHFGSDLGTTPTAYRRTFARDHRAPRSR